MKSFISAIALLITFSFVNVSFATIDEYPEQVGIKRPGETINEFRSSITEGFYCKEVKGELSNFLAENEPPQLESLNITPENPTTQDSIKVAAVINNDDSLTWSKTISATLFYRSDDDDDWNSVDMENREIPDTWTAEIPALMKQGDIKYFLTAEDDSGNLYIELQESDIKWGADEEPEYTYIIQDENDRIKAISDDLDILSVSLGYDGTYLYVKLLVEGEISGGTITPLKINMYSVGFYPSDYSRGEPAYILFHSQMSRFFSLPVIGLLDVDRGLSEIASAETVYYSHGNQLHMRMLKKYVDKDNTGRMKIIAGTSIGKECTPMILESIDPTSFNRVVFTDRIIEVR